MPNVLESLASGIVTTEFDGDTGIATVASVSGWLYENLGQVNTYLYTNFSGDDASGTYGFMDIEAQNVLRSCTFLITTIKRLGTPSEALLSHL